jgi:hypothetical protein
MKLHAAADRVEVWLAKVDAARDQVRDEEAAEEPAPPAPARKGFWIFGRRKDPLEDKSKAILKDLERVTEGRPEATAHFAAQRQPQPAELIPPAKPLTRRASE